jgi:hypothetical protein
MGVSITTAPAAFKRTKVYNIQYMTLALLRSYILDDILHHNCIQVLTPDVKFVPSCYSVAIYACTDSSSSTTLCHG